MVAEADGKRILRLALANSGRSSAHFALYPYAEEFAEPQHTDVRGKAQWDVPLTNGTYNVTVTGPNGFRREFAGTAEDTAGVTGRLDARAREVSLTLSNSGDATLEFTVRPLAYADVSPRKITVRPGDSRTVVHQASAAHGWYDLEVTVQGADGEPGFRRRLMGHIENGEASVSG